MRELITMKFTSASDKCKMGSSSIGILIPCQFTSTESSVSSGTCSQQNLTPWDRKKCLSVKCKLPYNFCKAKSFSTMTKVSEGILLGIGNPLLDISIDGDEQLLNRYGLLSNNAVLATPEQHQIFHDIVKNYKPTFIAGGATQNSIRVAQWLLQVKNATTFLGAVGDDKFKDILEKYARGVGVNVQYQVIKGEKTGVCAAIIVGLDRSLITELGAAQKFSFDFLKKPENWALVEKAKFFYIGGFLLTVSPDSVLYVSQYCSSVKKTLVMNLHATFLCDIFADQKLGLLQHIDILFGNGDEAQALAKAIGLKSVTIKDIAVEVASLPKVNSDRPRIVIFTQGKDPTYIATEGKVQEMPVDPIDPSLIKDTNGCGDAFVGGFLSQLVQGKPLSECLRCGRYAAKVVIQHFGCTFDERPDFV
ncbi:uncharacterized protein LOC106073830 isoform X1 [Biomphalaria glabrata]|uniref:Adenosine kinase n=2 Tax=Biomphalaria glabrata TaxID=6526 RepID=A0A9U8EJX7_BIOGL|nr:uncharacterized protein LOC106073830 isoform X1 [Biomphalaria glabrata]